MRRAVGLPFVSVAAAVDCRLRAVCVDGNGELVRGFRQLVALCFGAVASVCANRC